MNQNSAAFVNKVSGLIFFFSSFLAANSNRQALKFVLLFCLMHELLLTTALCVWHAKGDLQKFCPNFSIKKKILFQTFSEILIFFLCDFFSFFVSHLSLSLSLSLFFLFLLPTAGTYGKRKNKLTDRRQVIRGLRPPPESVSFHRMSDTWYDHLNRKQPRNPGNLKSNMCKSLPGRLTGWMPESLPPKNCNLTKGNYSRELS